jgi:hypothetical protein
MKHGTPHVHTPPQQEESLQQQSGFFAARAGAQQAALKPVNSDTETFTPQGACPIRGSAVDACMAGTAGFWQAFGSSIHILCLSEVKHALMAQSLVGVPGAMTLLCNLSTTVDFGLDAAQVEHVSIECLLCSMPTVFASGWLVRVPMGLHAC